MVIHDVNIQFFAAIMTEYWCQPKAKMSPSEPFRNVPYWMILLIWIISPGVIRRRLPAWVLLLFLMS